MAQATLTLLMLYQRDDINASILNSLPRAAVFSNPNGRVPLNFRTGDPGFEFWDLETRSISYLFSHQFSDALTFRQNLRFAKKRQDSLWLYRRSLSSDRRTLDRNVWQPREDGDYLTIDNQLQWKLTTGKVKHILLTGIDYQKSSYQSRANFGGRARPLIDLFAPVYNQTITVSARPNRNNKNVIRQTGIYMAGSNQDWRFIPADWRAL